MRSCKRNFIAAQKKKKVQFVNDALKTFLSFDSYEWLLYEYKDSKGFLTELFTA